MLPAYSQNCGRTLLKHWSFLGKEVGVVAWPEVLKRAMGRVGPGGTQGVTASRVLSLLVCRAWGRTRRPLRPQHSLLEES